MKQLNSHSSSDRKSAWAEFWRIVLNQPEIPPEDGAENGPAARASRPEAPAAAPPVPPAYEYVIEPLVFLVGYTLSLAMCLVTLWLLMQSPFGTFHLTVAAITWGFLAYCGFRMVQGVRYGSSIRLYKGYMEVRQMGPTTVVTAGEVAYFREFHKESRSRRRVCLYLRSGQRICLPNVPEPEILYRALVEDVGIHQAL